jgi:predicted ATPase
VPGKRIVTLVFTDMEGSTHLLGSLGDAFLPVLERQRVILGAAAGAQGGTGYATGGDGCVFLFGSPSSAVATAVEAQRALAIERWPDGVCVRVRMAIHAGEVADLGDELFGIAMHHASRILGVTHGGQVLLSGAAVGLITELPAGIALRDLGPHRLRDIVRPVQLHQAVAEGIATAFPPLKTATTSGARSLPAPTTSFVGRERELREVIELLASRRLVTLTGIGGCGKTRLALEVARRVEDRHRDGVCLVELAGLGTDALVPEAVLGALGMREPTGGRSATEFLCASLADRDLLLVLDNCEHVGAGVAALGSELLRACTQLHVLATSREPLRVPGEVERAVPPLERPDPHTLESPERLAEYDAVRLLVERGADVRPGFRVTDQNAAAVARICAELAGLPLAIELSAARLRTLSPEQVAARLGEQLDLLTHGGRSRPDRQQTMRATLDWSHQLLAPDEQIVFRRLSVFAGGFTLAAAEEVAGGETVEPAAVSDMVERLASRSLVAVEHDRDEPRLHMLEPVRQYAAERLNQAGEYDRAVRRHLEWVLTLAVRAGIGLQREQHHWNSRLRDERDNIREAMERALAGVDPEVALRIAAALGNPWFAMGQPEARGWVARALAAAPGAPDLIRAMALFGAGMLAENALNYDEALVHLRRALAISRALGARGLEGWVLMAMGRAAWAIDVDARPSAAWWEDALEIFRDVNEPTGIGWMLSFTAQERWKNGDMEGALDRATEALDLGTRLGLPGVVAESRRVLAMVAAMQGRHADASRLLEDAAAAHEQAGDNWQLALILTFLALHLALDRGDYARAFRQLRRALRLARDGGMGERMWDAVEVTAIVVHHRGRVREAATLMGAVEAVDLRFPRKQELRVRAARAGHPFGKHHTFASMVPPESDEYRVAGRSLSLERAADLALWVLDEELALAAAAGAGGSEATGEAALE